ncbi:MAG: hypothetical protein U1F66_05240 [bacterium]
MGNRDDAGIISGIERKSGPNIFVTKIFCVILAYIPVLRIARIVNRYGENNPSSDDLRYFGLIDRVLHGEYQWGGFFRDTFQANGHQNVFPVLFQVFSAKMTDFNYYFVLNLVLFLFVLKLILLFLILGFRIREIFNYLLLVPVSLLVFSYSQISVFEHDFGGLQISLNHLGFLLGVWGMMRYPGRWKGALLACLGGFISTWSWGGGVVSWPIYLFGFLLLGFRRPAQYLCLILAGCLACWPYFFYLFLNSATRIHQVAANLPDSGFVFLLRGIGLPLANAGEWDRMFRFGILGISLLTVTLLFFLPRIRKALSDICPFLMLIFFGILHICLVAIFRGTLTPWYSSTEMFFWIGLLGLAAFLGQEGVGKTPRRDLGSLVKILVTALVFLSTAYAYGVSNLTWEDKSAFLKTRAPASASCVRNYQTAPTYCEKELFVWDNGQFWMLDFLARPLERSGLSVFAKKQKWLLQGDFILSKVRVFESLGIPNIRWISGEDGKPYGWDDFRRLDLFLHSPNSVEWTLTIPENLRHAFFDSAVRISPDAPKSNLSDGLVAKILLIREGEEPVELFKRKFGPRERSWVPVRASLLPYAGTEVKIVFQSDALKNPIHDWLTFRSPSLELELEGANIPSGNRSLSPENTELGESFSGPQEGDLLLPIDQARFWRSQGGRLSVDAGAVELETLGKDQSMVFERELEADSGRFSKVYFKIAMDPRLSLRAAKVQVDFQNRTRFSKEFLVPLLQDGNEHQYTFDFKLLDLVPEDRVVGIRFLPLAASSASCVGCKIRLASLALLRK